LCLGKSISRFRQLEKKPGTFFVPGTIVMTDEVVEERYRRLDEELAKEMNQQTVGPSALRLQNQFQPRPMA